MPADKPTKIMKLSNAILMDALSKPEINPHWQPKEKPTKFRKGRTAYKIDVYQKKTSQKIHELNARMNAIGNRQDDEWKRLRK